MDVNWSQQHCGVRKAPISTVKELMPDLIPLLETFPEDPAAFTWDVKVHLLMPMQFPCIPNWHHDCVPTVDGVPQLDLAKPDLPIYLWVSGLPVPEFEEGFVRPRVWHKFNQMDRHRGVAATAHCWRGFIRAAHVGIEPPKAIDHIRRHCQVYLDAGTFQC